MNKTNCIGLSEWDVQTTGNGAVYFICCNQLTLQLTVESKMQKSVEPNDIVGFGERSIHTSTLIKQRKILLGCYEQVLERHFCSRQDACGWLC